MMDSPVRWFYRACSMPRWWQVCLRQPVLQDYPKMAIVLRYLVAGGTKYNKAYKQRCKRIVGWVKLSSVQVRFKD